MNWKIQWPTFMLCLISEYNFYFIFLFLILFYPMENVKFNSFIICHGLNQDCILTLVKNLWRSLKGRKQINFFLIYQLSDSEISYWLCNEYYVSYDQDYKHKHTNITTRTILCSGKRRIRKVLLIIMPFFTLFILWHNHSLLT